MIWSFIILFAFMIAGFPLYVALLLSGLHLLVIVSNVSPSMVITALFDGADKFTMAAIPFFLLAGSLMQKSSMTERLVNFINPWFVKVRGGIGITSVLANEVFGAMSGSSAAAVGTIGRTMFDSVKKTSGERFALGLFASCGSLAIIMPPSITMILFACATNVSTGALFLAGIIPAIITGIVISIYIIIKSKPVDVGARFDLAQALKNFKDSILVLLLPIIILGGIYGGFFTPTEAGAISAFYCLFITCFIYREIGWKDVVECLQETTILTGKLFILLAVSTVFSQALAVAQVSTLLMNLLSGLSSLTFLLLLNVLLLIVGCFFDTASAVIIIAPVIAPLGAALGIDPIHLGLVFTFNLAIGMFTPPFGINLFIAQSIFNKSLEAVGRSVVSFFLLYLVVLAIITYFPELYLWLPYSMLH